MTKKQFTTPLECAEHREATLHNEGYNQFFERSKQNARKGKRQLPCGKCGRFLWPEDRCNLFERLRTLPYNFIAIAGVGPTG